MAVISSNAQTVKYADMLDNCLDISKHDAVFGKVFINESSFILEAMNTGNQELYQRVSEVIKRFEECF